MIKSRLQKQIEETAAGMVKRYGSISAACDIIICYKQMYNVDSDNFRFWQRVQYYIKRIIIA